MLRIPIEGSRPPRTQLEGVGAARRVAEGYVGMMDRIVSRMAASMCGHHAVRLGAVVFAVGILGVPVMASAQPAWRLDRSEPITYFIGQGSPASGFREGDRTLAEWALRAWSGETDPPVQVVEAPEASATVRVYWAPAGVGQYGEMRARIVGGRRVAEVFIRPDTEGLGPEIARLARIDALFRDTIVYLTCVHELGHAFGLSHTDSFADIMYSFQYGGDLVAYFMRFRDQIEVRDDIQEASPFSSADRAAFISAPTL